ncbi:MAG TPA: Fe-Mn family superoxide dismutase [Gammaproteobacteria bacterium]|jgi:Fe-Mn family superoxide dismutase|nr:Fe-Mn family superoxide dismutase [Gammaproteobacteria bacterium]
MFNLVSLPYSLDALQPHISKETLEYHYGKHHKAYVDNLNKLVVGTPFEGAPLEKIIMEASGPVFNNAAQDWNHTFYWHSLSPNSAREPFGELADAINKKFGSFAEFKKSFTEAGTKLFGSGWTWLAKDKNGELEIINESNAGLPMKSGKTAILTCDVWEHAYYIDYRNARASYLETFWNIANWDFAAENFAK